VTSGKHGKIKIVAFKLKLVRTVWLLLHPLPELDRKSNMKASPSSITITNPMLICREDPMNLPRLNYTSREHLSIMKGCFGAFKDHLPPYVRTFSLHEVRENCHFLNPFPHPDVLT